MSDVIERYEANAAAFFKDTGVMAPGKDVSAAMGEYDADELRHKLWKMWARAVYAEREREAMQGVVDAAVEWEKAKTAESTWNAEERMLGAVRAHLATMPNGAPTP